MEELGNPFEEEGPDLVVLDNKESVDSPAFAAVRKVITCLQSFNLHHAWTWYGTPTELTHSKLVQEQSVVKECTDVW